MRLWITTLHHNLSDHLGLAVSFKSRKEWLHTTLTRHIKCLSNFMEILPFHQSLKMTFHFVWPKYYVCICWSRFGLTMMSAFVANAWPKSKYPSIQLHYHWNFETMEMEVIKELDCRAVGDVIAGDIYGLFIRSSSLKW